jgi:GNAT superfamily N-acetyltransferase
VPNIEIAEVGWDDPAAVALRDAHTAEVGPRYADREAEVPAGMNVLPEEVVWTALAYSDGSPIGHVALRRLPGTAPTAGEDLEIKRMFVDAKVRGNGIGRRLLAAAERRATELGTHRLVLQTGDRQPDAVALYSRTGYSPIPVYAPYEALTFSHCFEKHLDQANGAG